MSEAELLLLASEALNRMWSLSQWWASISFGLLVVSHIASDRIGAYLAILISLLYTGFTFLVLGMAARNMGIVESVFGDLHALEAAGVELTLTAQFWKEGVDSAMRIVTMAVFVLTYTGIMGYFIYSCRNTKPA